MSRQSDTKDISQKIVQVNSIIGQCFYVIWCVHVPVALFTWDVYLICLGYFIQIAFFTLFDNIAKIMGLLYSVVGVVEYGGRGGF